MPVFETGNRVHSWPTKQGTLHPIFFVFAGPSLFRTYTQTHYYIPRSRPDSPSRFFTLCLLAGFGLFNLVEQPRTKYKQTPGLRRKHVKYHGIPVTAPFVR